jgi:hypothetical protein
MILCAYCQRRFDPDRTRSVCAGCVLLTNGCGRARCPHCGFENQRPLKDAYKGLMGRLRGVIHGSHR